MSEQKINMKKSVKVKFPYYTGNIYETDVLGIVTLPDFINSHRDPSEKVVKLLKEINEATEAGDLKQKRLLKQQLFAFTPSVFIEVGRSRKYRDVKYWTGLMQLDFDGIDDVEEAKLLKKTIFENHKEIVCAYLSPSGHGVKCLMRTTTPRDQEHYKALHQGMVNTFEEYSYLDLATKNAVLPLFLSADPDILAREYEDCDVWSQEDWTVTKHVALKDQPNFTYTNYSDRQKNYYYTKVVNIITKRISNIIDNGHPQVRSTGLILGSRVAADYIDVVDAESLLTHLIKNNNYLNKGLDGYLRTAMWAIHEGMKAPKYF